MENNPHPPTSPTKQTFDENGNSTRDMVFDGPTHTFQGRTSPALREEIEEYMKMTPKFQFGNIVVVEDDLIGVIVKSWGPDSREMKYSHEVYVRYFNGIKDYPESEIKHYVFSKELLEEQKDFYE